ncbi:MAG TPA: adenylate/guanylate cyclase domain-containing protein, partial [Chloroflexi bacterium]|nr:adenylate/guanylate cyclase domain-containing protein [Chloroflexota bacterium]
LAVFFISFATQIQLNQFIGPVGGVVGAFVAFVYLFYRRHSTHIRRFLAVLIEGQLPDPELATAAWAEAVAFPQQIVIRVTVGALVVHGFQVIFSAPRYGLSPSLIGGVVAMTATVALGQVIFLFYLERAMQPIVQLTLATGARPSPSHLARPRLRFGTKLLLFTLFIIIVPVTVVGLFGYSQVVMLGGDPTIALALTGLVALLASGIAVLLVFLLVRSVSLPIQELQRVIEEVGRGRLDVSARPFTADELAELSIHFNQMIAQLRQQEKLKAAFGRYVSEAVRDGILSGQIALGGERREVTILFSDIRDFTTWCERTPPETVIQTLNSYYENLISALIKYGGTVTRYTGDGVLALFGAPLEDPDHALHAVQAAWEAQGLLEKFNAIRRSVGAFELRTGFGIHTGTAVVGSIGCEARAEYTPVGDAANVASRIEGLNRELGTTLLISDATYRRVADWVVVGRRAEVRVKGRSRPVQVVEVVGLRSAPFGEEM